MAYLGISLQSGAFFPFIYRNYDKTTNEERKISEIIAIVETVGIIVIR